MTSVALAVTDGVPLFELAAPCAIFGIARPELVDPWYDFTVCAPAGVQVGGWFRADTPHKLDELAVANTVIVPACHDIAHSPPPTWWRPCVPHMKAVPGWPPSAPGHSY